MKRYEGTIAWRHEGASLITVLAIIAVLMSIVLSVLAISYQYLTLRAGDVNREKCEEAASTLAEELQKEITGVHFTTYDQQIATKNEIWLYLRENVAQESWPYLAREEAGTAYVGTDPFVWDMDDLTEAADTKAARRYFSLEPTAEATEELKSEMPITTVCMYWTPGKYTDRVTGTKLYVEITAEIGDDAYTITDVYDLETDSYSTTGDTTKVTAQTNANTIYKDQKWDWVYQGEK